jgi:hypothetical protein
VDVQVAIIRKVAAVFIQSLDDKRHTVRVNFVAEVKVIFAAEGRTVQGRLQNLSIDGMLLATKEVAPEGTPCKVVIEMPDRYSRLIIDGLAGEVVRSAAGELGIRFLHPFEWLALFHVYHSKSSP